MKGEWNDRAGLRHRCGSFAGAFGFASYQRDDIMLLWHALK